MKKTDITYSTLFFFSIPLFFIQLSGAFSKVSWAESVIAFSSQVSPSVNSAQQALGPFSVMPGYGASPAAWSPASDWTESGEWIHLAFPLTDVRQIALFENFNPGSIDRIILIDDKRKEHVVFQDTLNYIPDRNGIVRYVFPEEIVLRVAEAKIFLNTAHIPGYNQLDAVGLSDETDSIKPHISFDSAINMNYAQNLGFEVNSEFPELAPVITYDGRKIFFTRQGHPDNIGNEKKQDIWFTEKDAQGKFRAPVNIGPPLNNRESNFLISVSPSGNEAYVGNIYESRTRSLKGVSRTRYDGKGWTDPLPAEFESFKNVSPYAAYFIASDNRTMLLSLDDEKGYGNTDIMVSFLHTDGKWSSPANLGSVINTADMESSPFLAADGKTLYFSTGGHPGFGASDIFYSVRLDDTWGNWSEPVNLGPGINTPGWEGYFTIPAQGNIGYFVSSTNSIGAEDIFRISLEDGALPQKVMTVAGRVRNKKNGDPLSAEIIYEFLENSEKAGSTVSNPLTGEYAIVLPYGRKYAFMAVAEGFYPVSSYADLTGKDSTAFINADLDMVPVEVGSVIRLNNIFFAHGSHELLPDSFSELDRVVAFLNKNPRAGIEINGHTDNTGDDKTNMELSKKRAEEVRSHIIGKGIEKDRIGFRFFGKDKPVAGNDTEEGRRLNRRVEFVITKLE